MLTESALSIIINNEEIPKKFGIDIDIMIEAKHKELAIFKLYEKYPFLNCKIK